MNKTIFFKLRHRLKKCWIGLRTLSFIALLSTCIGKKDLDLPPDFRPYCLSHYFEEGQEDNLYGVDCLEGKRLIVKTAKNGDHIVTSQAVGKDSESALRLEGKLDFINKFYNNSYKILKGQGDDKKNPILKSLLPQTEKFFGLLDKKYSIIFEVRGDHLVLFKAVKDPYNLPYTERTSLVLSKDKQYSMVPFLGYKIQYCEAEVIKNSQLEETNRYRSKCSNHLKGARYIRIISSAKNYQYEEGKIDLFPAKYFDFAREEEPSGSLKENSKGEGRWFFSAGPIESSEAGELSASEAYFVKLRKKERHIEIVDVSGNIKKDQDKNILAKAPVEWVEYEIDQQGGAWNYFGERINRDKNPISRPFLKIYFKGIQITGDDNWELGQMTDLLVSKDYLSFVVEKTEKIQINKRTTEKKIIKYKISLRRVKAEETKGFAPKRWFLDFNDHVFGILPVTPQLGDLAGELSEDDKLKYTRMIHFNTSLNSPEEKQTQTKVIKWYFSKNSTKDPKYRSLAEEAIRIYNRAFEIITKDSPKKIKVVLEKEDKDLGDLRYNIINLVKAENLKLEGLFGIAPSYVYSNTGQIIGATSNILAHNIIEIWTRKVRDYIRYKVFKEGFDDFQAVSLYIKTLIEQKCPELEKFITQKKSENPKPRDSLKDRKMIVSCAENISKLDILSTILHEIGHNFGLGHNFKGSVDKANYYQSLEELRDYFPKAKMLFQIAQTSSVMDYLPVEANPPTYLGKYDLAALRFLYLNQIETEEGNLKDLTIHSDPFKQIALDNSLSQNHSLYQKRRGYLHCGDYVNREIEDFLCIRWDHGSTPVEIVNFYINSFYQSFHSRRYRYDGAFNPSIFLSDFHLLNIVRFYQKWIELRDEYLLSEYKTQAIKYIPFAPQLYKKYNQQLESGLNKENKEYALYFGLRKIIPDFIMNLLFFESMKCEVLDPEGQTRFVDINLIKALLPKEHIAHCYSKPAQQLLKENQLKLTGQKGLENFVSFYNKGDKADQPDILPLNFAMYIFSTYFDGYKRRPWMDLAHFIKEPDFFNQFRLKAEKHLLNNEAFFSSSPYDIFNVFRVYFNFLLSGFKQELSQASHRDILYHHLTRYKTSFFTFGTGQNSIYQKFIWPFQNTGTAGVTDIPFLQSAFHEYSKRHSQEKVFSANPSFKAYMKSAEKEMSQDKKFMYEQSFSLQHFLAYLQQSDQAIKTMINTESGNQMALIIPFMDIPQMEEIRDLEHRISKNKKAIEQTKTKESRAILMNEIVEYIKQKKMELDQAQTEQDQSQNQGQTKVQGQSQGQQNSTKKLEIIKQIQENIILNQLTLRDLKNGQGHYLQSFIARLKNNIKQMEERKNFLIQDKNRWPVAKQLIKQYKHNEHKIQELRGKASLSLLEQQEKRNRELFNDLFLRLVSLSNRGHSVYSLENNSGIMRSFNQKGAFDHFFSLLGERERNRPEPKFLEQKRRKRFCLKSHKPVGKYNLKSNPSSANDVNKK